MQKCKTTATEISPEAFERRALVLAETQKHRLYAYVSIRSGKRDTGKSTNYKITHFNEKPQDAFANLRGDCQSEQLLPG